EPLTPACDQYSLAVIVYEMLSRKLPFWFKEAEVATTRLGVTQLIDQQQLVVSMSKRVLGQAPPKAEAIPDAAWAVIEKGLEKTAADRFDSAAAFGRALGAGIAAGGPSKTLLLAVAAGFLVVIGVLGYVIASM